MLTWPNNNHSVENLFYPIGKVDKDATRRFIEATVAAALSLPVDELGARTRRQAPVAFARQVSMYCAHTVLGMSLTETGQLFGRDRTTAAHACRVVEDRRYDPKTDHLVDLIEGVIRSWVLVVEACKTHQRQAQRPGGPAAAPVVPEDRPGSASAFDGGEVAR